METQVLTALASYCNNPNCQWASLDDDANKQAKALFTDWQTLNQWVKPWDGFLEICKTNGYPSASNLVKLGVGSVPPGLLQRFDYYGNTWAILA